ncbi:MAG: hypothetical protein AAGC46_01515 [Solirubrobacteraceae bacterium]|nr:hypothetical protein [Patulibacter sp.]
MDGPYSLMPPSGAPEGSETFARELAAFIAPYLEEHEAVFGGLWLDSIGSGRVACFAAFTDDLAPHRAALDHRVQVMAARHSVDDLEAIREDVRGFMERYDGARLREEGIDDRENRVVVGAETVEPESLRTALRERFGDLVTLRVDVFVTQLAAFDAWSLESTDDGEELTAHWLGGPGERAHRLELVEADRFVRVTVLFDRHEGAPAMSGMDMSATARLTEPLGDRVVIDATTGRQKPRYASPTAVAFDDDADWEEVEPPLPAGPISDAEMDASGLRAAELGDAVRAYVRDHTFVYGGMWTERHAGGVLLCVAFSEDARGHRAALDPAVKVLRCEYPVWELEAMQRDVVTLIEETDGATWSQATLTVSEGVIDLFASADDPRELARSIAGHFGAVVRLVPLDSPTHEPTPTAFDAYIADGDTHFLGVVWSEAAGGPALLRLDEGPDAVHVTVIESRPLPGTRPQSIEGRRAVASAHLRQALGGRAVIDATTGRTMQPLVLPDGVAG